MILIRIKIFQVRFQACRFDFSFPVRNFKHLMAGKFDGSGFMDADMPGGCCNHALIIVQHGRDNHGIGLCAACKKLHVCFGAAAGSAYFFPGTFTVQIRAIPGQRLHICFQKALQNPRMRACHIIIFKRYHYCVLPSAISWIFPVPAQKADLCSDPKGP